VEKIACAAPRVDKVVGITAQPPKEVMKVLKIMCELSRQVGIMAFCDTFKPLLSIHFPGNVSIM
jgi:hypothetical protein